MPNRIVSTTVLRGLLAAAVMTPIATLLLVGVAAVLGAMGDAAGQGVLNRIALALGLAWILIFVGIVLALVANGLVESEAQPRNRRSAIAPRDDAATPAETER